MHMQELLFIKYFLTTPVTVIPAQPLSLEIIHATEQLPKEYSQ